jgi:hypothetical protein
MRARIIRLDGFKERIGSAYRYAEMSKWTSDQLGDELTRTVYAHVDYKRLTIASREYLRGYRDATDNHLWYEKIVWRLGSIDGPLPEDVDGWKIQTCCVTAAKLKATKCPICGHDLANATGSYLGDLSREKNTLYGGHYWKGTDKVFTDYRCLNRPHCKTCFHDDIDHNRKDGSCTYHIGRECTCPAFVAA